MCPRFDVPAGFRRVATIPADHRPPTAGHAAAVRLAALCLVAASSDEELFREIAACVTHLELRAKGLAPVTETILLATA